MKLQDGNHDFTLSTLYTITTTLMSSKGVLVLPPECFGCVFKAYNQLLIEQMTESA